MNVTVPFAEGVHVNVFESVCTQAVPLLLPDTKVIEPLAFCVVIVNALVWFEILQFDPGP